VKNLDLKVLMKIFH